jgi:hypothetical protein
MIHKSIATALLLAAFGTAANAQVFKCTDQHGRNTFSDKPCRSNEKAAIAHKGMTYEQAYEQEMQHQQALDAKAARQLSNPNYGYAPSTPMPRYAPSRQSSGQAGTGPGNRATISTLHPNGSGFAQKEAARQQRQQERRAQQRSQPAATTLTHCDRGFCYDNQGGTLHRIGGGQMVSPSGKVCQTVGNTLHCN